MIIEVSEGRQRYFRRRCAVFDGLTASASMATGAIATCSEGRKGCASKAPSVGLGMRRLWAISTFGGYHLPAASAFVPSGTLIASILAKSENPDATSASW